MRQHNPIHPGEFVKRVYIEAGYLDSNTVAQKLQISSDEFNQLINGYSSITPVLATKLSNVLGRSSESWQLMQRNYDLWKSKQSLK